jgi:uncharacterized C2H2 Zn-finger protein
MADDDGEIFLSCPDTVMKNSNDPDIKHVQNNNTISSKDRAGKDLADKTIIAFSFWVLFFVMLTAFIVVFFTHDQQPKYYSLLSVALTSFVIATGFSIASANIVYDKPITVVYAISQFIARNTRTLPVINDPLTITTAVISLEGSFEQIKREISDFQTHGDMMRLTAYTYGGENGAIGRDKRIDETTGDVVGWKIGNVSVGNQFSDAAESYLPTLVNIIKANADVVSCVVSTIPGKTCIPRHIGYSKAVWRLMLPITVPDSKDVHLCVNGDTVHWTEGKCMMFDDTYVHSVNNKTDESRTVLYFDVQRRTGNYLIDRLLVHTLIDLISKSSTIQAELSSNEKRVTTTD